MALSNVLKSPNDSLHNKNSFRNACAHVPKNVPVTQLIEHGAGFSFTKMHLKYPSALRYSWFGCTYTILF